MLPVLPPEMPAPLPSPITVSTLAEARYFAEAGYKDILYAVGLTPNKYKAVNALLERGVDLMVVVDSLQAAKHLAAQQRAFIMPVRVLIELDVDDHRAGVNPESDELITIATVLSEAKNCEFSGLMAHAGASYGCVSADEKVAMAQQECAQMVSAAQRLAAQNIECAILSVGSTPTALAGCAHEGITEIRAGVYATFDLVMSDLNVCQQEDIAISVLTSVIGHQRDKNWVIVDAGWMALSRDKGSDKHGFGLVADVDGHILDGWYVSQTNQEHGIIKHKDGLAIPDDMFAYGSMLHILPNHACATAGQYREYLITSDNQHVEGKWKSTDGW